MKYNKILMLGILLLVLPLVFAQTYQKGIDVDLKIPFEVNGSVASSAATCNVSIDYPNGTYVKEEALMTNRDNGDFNITLIPSELSELGVYEWRAFCCDGTKCAGGYGDFEITTTGKTKVSVLNNQILLILILLGVVLIIFGFYLDFYVFSFLGALLFLLGGIYTMVYGLNDITNLYTRGVAIILIGVGFIFMFASAYDWLKDF